MRRWLVDVMNVVGSRPDRWWNDPHRAVRDMVRSLDDFARLTGDHVTAVLDKDPGEMPGLQHADVVVASWKGRNAADNEIVKIISAMDDVSDVRVVTSDNRLKERVGEYGARTFPSGVFRDRVDSAVRSGE